MYSCKLAKTTFDFKYSEAEKIPKSDKPTFSINNFRVLTSHLKSRNLINETKEPLLCSRPKTTPNFYWNFLNFEERKQTKSPPNIEKTLQRLNIRSFNNILRSNSMRKKPNPLPIRNALTPMKLEDTAKIRKSKKTEFYTLDHIKYNNYKYKKPILDENKLNPEKEKTNREVSMNEMCNGDLIEKLKANRIYYFEKNKLLLKKKFDRFYKMSESLKKMKHELHNCHISNKESHNPIKERNLGGTEKIKWESLFFNELNLLANLSNCVQKKINDKEIDEDFELNNIESFLRNSGDNYDDGLKSDPSEVRFIFVGVLIGYSNLFKKKCKILGERILLGFGLNPKNAFDKITETKFEEIFTLMNLLIPKKELYYQFVISFLKGGAEDADLDYEQFSSLLNLLNQNDSKKKMSVIIFEKNKIVWQNSRKKFDFERFLSYFIEKEDEFFDFVRVIFANCKKTQNFSY